MGGLTGIHITDPESFQIGFDMGYTKTLAGDDVAREQDLRERYKYLEMWRSTPKKFVSTMDKDLSSGKITKDFYNLMFSNKDRKKFQQTQYQQKADREAQERRVAEQQAALRQSQEKARKTAQQQRTLQGLESVDETSGEVVAVSGGGASETEESRGRRRRGGRLSAVLGI